MDKLLWILRHSLFCCGWLFRFMFSMLSNDKLRYYVFVCDFVLEEEEAVVYICTVFSEALQSLANELTVGGSVH